MKKVVLCLWERGRHKKENRISPFFTFSDNVIFSNFSKKFKYNSSSNRRFHFMLHSISNYLWRCDDDDKNSVKTFLRMSFILLSTTSLNISEKGKVGIQHSFRFFERNVCMYLCELLQNDPLKLKFSQFTKLHLMFIKTKKLVVWNVR